MDRRGLFFLAMATLCALLVWPTPNELRFVGWWVTGALAALGVLSLIDDALRHRGHGRNGLR
ncbi:MAG: hypothetical protein RL219_2508 [Actinomycetota bacterium]|jgi:UDP-N-acetylmuramyl pentapeptide phosphotransferase/UDP-N-acetylglucosamine-1-phosphate transferase